LHNKSSKKNTLLEIFYEKVVEGHITRYWRYSIQVQGQTCRQACRLVGRDHSIYNILPTHAKLAGKSQLSFLVSAEKDTSDPESCEDVLQRTAENAM
jgi:hypothetical protein